MKRFIDLLKDHYRYIRKCLAKYLLNSFKKYPLDSLLRIINFSNAFNWDSIKVPKKVTNFEDLSFLFWNCPLNRGIIRMDFDEAAILYKTIKKINHPIGVEIGRNRGGSTVLLATAMGEGGKLISIDINSENDETITTILGRIGVKDRVELMVGDSKKIEGGTPLDFVFIDGDHSYQGAKGDHLHWGKWVKNGGYIIHHDMANGRFFSTQEKELRELRNDILINQTSEIVIEEEVGSIVIIRRISDSWTIF